MVEAMGMHEVSEREGEMWPLWGYAYRRDWRENTEAGSHDCLF